MFCKLSDAIAAVSNKITEWFKSEIIVAMLVSIEKFSENRVGIISFPPACEDAKTDLIRQECEALFVFLM